MIIKPKDGCKAIAGAAVLAALLSGCVSVDDFRKMTPYERSHFVCSRHREVRGLDGEIDALLANISEIEETLQRGYRVHRSCKQVPVTESTTSKKTVKSKCRPHKKNKDTMICEEEEILVEDPRQEYHTVCDETPVAIDAAFEQEKLRGYRWELDDVAAIRDEVYSACVMQVDQMNAEEAYDFYKGN
ncbi:MAG: hypothetical protein OXC81_00825 [Betaproteobacteria bacterium]|nr:hypothetical protein [Betaproteobacteria bacterium]